MGYTHNFEQNQAPSADEWKAFKGKLMQAFELFLTGEDTKGIVICDGSGKRPLESSKNLFSYAPEKENVPALDDFTGAAKVQAFDKAISALTHEERKEYVCFNGDGRNDQDLGHETFYLPSAEYPEYNFCKTARKPYDLLVMIALVLAHIYMPGCYDLGTDGDNEEWQAAFDWLNKYMSDDANPRQLAQLNPS
jgi:hypothetical protein